MKTTKRHFLRSIAALILTAAALPGPAATEDETLARDTVKALDSGLSKVFSRPMQGEVIYQEEQSMALTIGINYSLKKTELGPDWAGKVKRLLGDMGAVNVKVSDNEISGEKLPIAGRQAVATHFNATRDHLEVVVIFLTL